MKILVISKRQYTGKDLIDDSYGRLYELPVGLSRLNNDVRAICWSYRKRPEKVYNIEHEDGRIQWQSLNIGVLIPIGIARYLLALDRVMEDFKPDIVWASSDCIHATLGRYIELLYETPCVIDLYDNYESFTLSKMPGIRMLCRSSVASVSGISCVSDNLNQHVRSDYKPRGQLLTLRNGIPDGLFRPLPRIHCRICLGLPADAMLIGTAGALSLDRDTNSLLDAFQLLREQYSNIYLVLAGPMHPKLAVPPDENIVYLGNLKYHEVPYFLNALNVAVICNKDSEFGKYCFPQKLYEIIACRIPVVCARTGDAAKILEAFPQSLYRPGDATSLADSIAYNMDHTASPDIQQLSWNDLSTRLEGFLEEVKRGHC